MTAWASETGMSKATVERYGRYVQGFLGFEEGQDAHFKSGRLLCLAQPGLFMPLPMVEKFAGTKDAASTRYALLNGYVKVNGKSVFTYVYKRNYC